MSYCQIALVNIISNHEYETVEAMELIRWAVRVVHCLTWTTNDLI